MNDKEIIEKSCLFCGDKFTPRRKAQKYCKKEHMGSCVVCGKEFLIKKLSSPAITCSSHCASIRSHTDKSKEKRRLNSLKKYGTDFPLQAEEIKQKIQRSLDDSENDFRFGSKKFKKAIKEKYGVENVSQLEHIKEKKKNSLMEHYGVENPMQSEEIRKAQLYSFKKNFEVERASEVGVTHLEEWRDLSSFIKNHKFTIHEMAKYFNVKKDKMVRECRRQEILHEIYQYGKFSSHGEQELVNYLAKRHPDVVYVRNDRTLLNGKELDFYFPEYKLAVEVSPTSTHNAVTGFNNSAGKEKNYHKDKFLACANAGIELITVFDWHDFNKVKEMISSKLSGSKIVYARKLVYKEETKLTKENFKKFSDWHVLSLPQNFKRDNLVSSLLDMNGEVLGLALWVDTKDPNIKELKRMVFKPNFRVPGGSSKLVSNFVKNHPQVEKLVTFSDCDLGTGSVYGKIGFTLIEESRPSVNYFHIKEKQHIKNLSLVMQGADRLLSKFPNYEPVGVGENLPSNQEIVESYGFLPVYDCGYRKWEMPCSRYKTY